MQRTQGTVQNKGCAGQGGCGGAGEHALWCEQDSWWGQYRAESEQSMHRVAAGMCGSGSGGS
eukprot:11337650-Prorocentrum_lima.AAC.1